jgi:PRTRC genetic system protein E
MASPFHTKGNTMLFTKLNLLLAACASINVIFTANHDGTLNVVVIPKGKKEGQEGEEGVLNTPLSLTGTPEELDAEFAHILESYTSKRKTLAEQLEATEAILEAAKKESQSKAAKAVTKSANKKSEKPKATSKDADEDEDENGEDDAPAGESQQTATTTPAPAATQSESDNVWG